VKCHTRLLQFHEIVHNISHSLQPLIKAVFGRENLKDSQTSRRHVCVWMSQMKIKRL